LALGGVEMDILHVILTVILVLDCVVLTALVLLQEGKSAGLGVISGAAETYWGKNKGRSMEGTLVKVTKVAAILFMVLAVILNINRIWA
jgi:preprotein translocase subunit SecG